jgi:hypothetical protein
MKLQTVRTAVLTALVLASPVLSYASAPTKVGIVAKAEAPNPADVTKAVQFGKGTGVTRNEKTLSGNAYRSETAQDKGAVKSAQRPNYSDRALRK